MKRKKRYVAYYDGTLDDDDLDPELASSERDGLMSKEDKVKLDSITNNNSTPITINATDVICDSEHRFVTDTLIAKLESVPSAYYENVFIFNEDGSLNILGFNDAEPGAQLVKGANGKVNWVKPSETTIEGMQTIVAELQADVTNLTTIVNNKVEKIEGKGLSTHDLTDELLAKINASSTNSIEIIKLAGTALPVEGKTVNIPIASTTNLGLVKASNSVKVNADGSLEVDNINVNNLTQSEGEYLVLRSGSSDKFID